MSIRIGANPIGWSNDDLQEIGGDTPLETCLAEAKEAGVVGVEKEHKLPNDGAALTAKLASFAQGGRVGIGIPFPHAGGVGVRGPARKRLCIARLWAQTLIRRFAPPSPARGEGEFS
jgi:hypothetical protein